MIQEPQYPNDLVDLQHEASFYRPGKTDALGLACENLQPMLADKIKSLYKALFQTFM